MVFAVFKVFSFITYDIGDSTKMQNALSDFLTPKITLANCLSAGQTLFLNCSMTAYRPNRL